LQDRPKWIASLSSMNELGLDVNWVVIHPTMMMIMPFKIKINIHVKKSYLAQTLT
jgi:hypothetical protein